MTETEMKDKVIEFVQSSTREVFQTMLGMESTSVQVFDNGTPPQPTNGVMSLIGMAGPWVGTGSLWCSSDLACKISSGLLMAEYAAVNEEVLDAVAEVTNMVIGNVKTAVEELVGPMGLSIPTVIFGRNFATRSIGANNWTVIEFECGGEKLHVQVCLTAKQEGHAGGRLGISNPLMSHH